jgi:hypothetical protein
MAEEWKMETQWSDPPTDSLPLKQHGQLSCYHIFYRHFLKFLFIKEPLSYKNSKKTIGHSAGFNLFAIHISGIYEGS